MADLLADVRVADVEVVVARGDVLDADFPGLLSLDAGFETVFLGAPPVDLGLELLEAHGLALVIVDDALRVGVLVEPDFLGGGLLALGFLGEEEDVGLDACVGIEDAVGKADNGVELALFQEVFLEAGLHALAEEEAVGQDDGGAAVVFEQLDDERHEEVGGLAGAEVGREVVFDAVFFGAAERGIGDDDVDAVLVAVVFVGGVVVTDLGGGVDAVQDHIGGAEHVWKRLLFDAVHARGERALVGVVVHVVLALVLDGAGEEAAGPAGGVENRLIELRVDTVDDKLGDGAGRVELARVARALEVFEDLLVDVTKGVAVVCAVEVDLADFVDDLADQGSGLHVVVGIFKDVLNDLGACAFGAFEHELFFERWEELVVDEFGELLTSHAFGVGGPVAPAQGFGDGGLVVALVIEQLDFGFAVVVNFEEEHPDELADALCVAVDADVLAHYVLDGFNDAAYVAHAEVC